MKFKHASPPSDPFYTCSTSLITTVHASKGVPGLLSLMVVEKIRRALRCNPMGRMSHQVRS